MPLGIMCTNMTLLYFILEANVVIIVLFYLLQLKTFLLLIQLVLLLFVDIVVNCLFLSFVLCLAASHTRIQGYGHGVFRGHGVRALL